MASQSFAMRKPTSGGQGFSISPARTCVNCSQAPRILGKIGFSRLAFTLAADEESLAVYAGADDAAGQIYEDLILQTGDAIAAAVERDQRARLQTRHDHAIDVDRRASIVGPGRDCPEVLDRPGYRRC